MSLKGNKRLVRKENKRVGLEEMTFILVEERTEIVGCGYVVYESRWKRYQLRTGACWALGALY